MRTIALVATLTFALHAGAQSTGAQSTAVKSTAAHTHVTTKKLSSAKHHTAPKLVAAAPAVPASPAAPAVVPTPYAQNPIQQLRGTARAILIFAPDTASPVLLTQLALLERNELALTERDTVLVPIIAKHHGEDEAFPGENISPGTDGDQLSARLKFNVQPADFTIILLDKDGNVALRSSTPITVADIGARIDGVPKPGV